MNLVLGRDYEIAQWVFDRLGHNIEPPFTAIGFADDTGLRVGAVFNDYVPTGNVELTLAGERPLSRFVLRTISDYAFEQLGCARMTVRTMQSNEKVGDLAKRAGFVREGAQKDYFGPGKNAELFRMLKKECRWLR